MDAALSIKLFRQLRYQELARLEGAADYFALKARVICGEIGSVGIESLKLEDSEQKELLHAHASAFEGRSLAKVYAGLRERVARGAYSGALAAESEFTLGFISLQRGRYLEASAHFERASELYLEASLPGQAAVALFNVCVCSQYLQRELAYRSARERLDRLAKDFPIPAVQLHHLRIRAYASLVSRDYASCENELAQACELARDLGRRHDLEAFLQTRCYMALLRQDTRAFEAIASGYESDDPSHYQKVVVEMRELVSIPIVDASEARKLDRRWSRLELEPVGRVYLCNLLLEALLRSAGVDESNEALSLARKYQRLSKKLEQGARLVNFRAYEAIALRKLGREGEAELMGRHSRGERSEESAPELLPIARNELILDLDRGRIAGADGHEVDLERSKVLRDFLVELSRHPRGISIDRIFKKVYDVSFHPLRHQARIDHLIGRARAALGGDSALKRDGGLLSIDPSITLRVTRNAGVDTGIRHAGLIHQIEKVVRRSGRTDGRFTYRDLLPSMQLSPRTLNNDLTALVDQGTIERKGKTKGTLYYYKAAVRALSVLIAICAFSQAKAATPLSDADLFPSILIGKLELADDPDYYGSSLLVERDDTHDYFVTAAHLLPAPSKLANLRMQSDAIRGLRKVGLMPKAKSPCGENDSFCAPVKIVGVDPGNDVAVISVEHKPLASTTDPARLNQLAFAAKGLFGTFDGNFSLKPGDHRTGEFLLLGYKEGTATYFKSSGSPEINISYQAYSWPKEALADEPRLGNATELHATADCPQLFLKRCYRINLRSWGYSGGLLLERVPGAPFDRIVGMVTHYIPWTEKSYVIPMPELLASMRRIRENAQEGRLVALISNPTGSMTWLSNDSVELKDSNLILRQARIGQTGGGHGSGGGPSGQSIPHGGVVTLPAISVEDAIQSLGTDAKKSPILPLLNSLNSGSEHLLDYRGKVEGLPDDSPFWDLKQWMNARELARPAPGSVTIPVKLSSLSTGIRADYLLEEVSRDADHLKLRTPECITSVGCKLTPLLPGMAEFKSDATSATLLDRVGNGIRFKSPWTIPSGEKGVLRFEGEVDYFGYKAQAWGVWIEGLEETHTSRLFVLVGLDAQAVGKKGWLLESWSIEMPSLLAR